MSTSSSPSAAGRRSATVEDPFIKAKTSAAAVFGLVFGLAALFCAATAILAPAALVLGIIGLVLSVVGIAMSRRPHVTGRGVAIGGLLTALLGLILSGALLAGAAFFLNDRSSVNRLNTQIHKLEKKLPTAVPTP